MTVSRVVLLAVAATGAWASDTAQAADWDIAVCMNPGRYAIPFYLARATVSQILKQAGIRIEWHGDARACTASGVSIAVYEQTPSDTAAEWSGVGPMFRCSDLIVQLSESFAPISSFLRVPAGGTQ
jgi:hypothetical protein